MALVSKMLIQFLGGSRLGWLFLERGIPIKQGYQDLLGRSAQQEQKQQNTTIPKFK